MARDYARIVTAIWGDPDWRDLTPDAQRMFMALLSQPKLTMIGVIDYMPERWAAHAKGLTAADIDSALSELEAGDRPWVFVDRDSGEVLIRTFVRHDGSANNQKLRAPMWNAWKSIESDWLRREVLDHLPDEAWTEGKTGAPPPEAKQLRDTPFQRPGIGYSRVENQPRNTPQPEPHPQPEPNTPSSADADGELVTFEQFWAECPRKVGKGAARKAWIKAIKRADPAEIAEAMTAHAQHWRDSGTEERFVPHPSTWLNEDRWLDELRAPPPADEPDWGGGVMTRNEARARGEACPDCAGVGWVEIPGTNDAQPCACSKGAIA